MARKPRYELIDNDSIGIYHIFSRTVRRSFLFGEDFITGKCYDHRMDLLQTLMRTLARVFTIDILGYGFMQNHFHEILRNRPDIAARLSGIQVAMRTVLLEELGLNVTLEPRERTERQKKRLKQKIADLLHDKERLHRARQSLCSISRYEQRLKQTISRLANAEDDVTGHFWDGRFESIHIETIEQLLTTMVYVDLNAIRAGIARRPEDSRFTSVYDRIHSLRARIDITMQNAFQHDFDPEDHPELQALAQEREVRRILDSWLSPIDERREAVASEALDESETVMIETDSPWEAMTRLVQEDPIEPRDEALEDSSSPARETTEQTAQLSTTTSKLGGDQGELCGDIPQINELPPRASNKGCFSMRLQDYISLVDWVGRQSRLSNRGTIPADLAPILDRLSITSDTQWLARIEEYHERLRKVHVAPVNQPNEAKRCVVQTPNGRQAFPDALL
ncbi:MAG: hypothetical protein KDB23_07620 [Planctomycetales bacterium]|nr:hypothetical protein [Planctomycetales bacterium]